MNKFLAGALGGFAATVPMTMVMVYLHRQIPKKERKVIPPKQITVKVADDLGVKEAIRHQPEKDAVSLVNHFAYGTTTGALYAPLASSIDLPPLVKGTAYGLAVWAGSYLGWLPLLNIRQPATERPASENAMMIAAHIVWGACLGVLTEQMTDRNQ